ncbi:hypothetical protein GCM10011495_35600 [Hymenobacter frigidus]|uniref:Uncharacterized protein n=1 Tax=Hymenobacter frigidus TaxID=1524095 RepID=A0ABQ2ADF3_9BACT|nr:hypothetical protein GCM10011495_35600 [Hymenobacter frigidus]
MRDGVRIFEHAKAGDFLFDNLEIEHRLRRNKATRRAQFRFQFPDDNDPAALGKEVRNSEMLIIKMFLNLPPKISHADTPRFATDPRHDFRVTGYVPVDIFREKRGYFFRRVFRGEPPKKLFGGFSRGHAFLFKR